MTRGLASAVLLALGVAGCAVPPLVDKSWIADAKAISAAVPPKLLAALQAEIASGGPEGAVAACRDMAPAMARTASQQTGWSIRRVSLRNRNPQAVPDAWERAALEDFDRRAAAHESPAGLEHAELTLENGQPVQRYIRALPTLALCTQCHGPAATLSPAVQARLTALYPGDRATGYRVGDIRGAITLRRPAPP